jgi:uncharacterized heparinase superfamily protein
MCRAMRIGSVAISGDSLAERGRLWWFATRRGLGALRARTNALAIVRHVSLRLSSDRLLIAPQDLRTADPTRANEIYAGQFAFAGKIVVCDAHSPFEMDPPSLEWAETLLGFSWLGHLRAAESQTVRAAGRALVADWMALQGSWGSLAWRPEIVARRVMSWLSQAPLVLQDVDVRFYRRFLRNLTRQVRYLRRTAAVTADGVPRLQTLFALTYASLCMAGQARYLKATSRWLASELERQVLPDGGHISRNPDTLIDLLLDLLPLKQAFAARNVPPPAAVLNAIDRMMPMLRFFRHGDGNFALFNGMGPTSPELLATVLAYDDARGAPLANAPHCGYQRLQTEGLLVIMDTGRPPPIGISQEAHAGCLAFELSWKQHRIVVNCGLPAISRETWRPLARATSAHSTVTFNGESSAQIFAPGPFQRVLGAPLFGGPTTVPVSRHDRDRALLIRATHDGYARRFGILHQRSLRLAANGGRFDGEDLFLGARSNVIPSGGPDEFAVRFHLHPSIKVNRLANDAGIMLTLPNRDVWRFNAHDDHISVEESVYLAGPEGPRRTFQIVIHGQARTVPRVRWTFMHIDPNAPGPQAGAGGEVDLSM